MRQETDKIVTAFLARKPAAAARTATDGTVLLLHGNRIAWHTDDGKIMATLAGWPTVTTRDRLNELARRLRSPGFSQMNFRQYFGDKEVGANDVVEMKPGVY
jgi:hypothetical protein